MGNRRWALGRRRGPLRTLLVFVLLGAAATVLSSWAIHAVRFRMASTASSQTFQYVPSIPWPLDPEIARRIGIDTTVRSGQLGIDPAQEVWRSSLTDEDDPGRIPPIAPRVNADAAWRRHRQPSDRLPDLPDYPFPYKLFEVWPTGSGWHVLRSNVDLWNQKDIWSLESVEELLFVIRVGWPRPALEVGAHHAQLKVFPRGFWQTSGMISLDRVEELAHPPIVSLGGGIQLWGLPGPRVPAFGIGGFRFSPLDRFALPLLPIWPGFAINTAFYALLLYLAWRTPIAIRRARRRRRGRCAQCGYDRRGLDAGAACPECGAGLGPPRHGR